MQFRDALRLVLKWEGGFSNHPNDPGGATNLGITHRTLSEWYGRAVPIEDLRSLTVGEAEPLYRSNYWDACRCQELPNGVDLMIFDCAVNQGPGRAKRLLQRALGVAEDGVLGQVSMKAALSHDRLTLIDELAAQRAVHYARLDRAFHLGWFRRLSAVHRRALE